MLSSPLAALQQNEADYTAHFTFLQMNRYILKLDLPALLFGFRLY